ncbi:hypothetical protein EST38_g6940 [Candolleomyces aberdarensis]|uniref:Fungal-type protein kinase domain-containing protein n=1 Tax=Candolleomyces aberdarensis TaxID=2316362 RepID=A0A4Q2DJD1_9AGAR|nr:hypothetical protein EST38_g6940 [Candolleomyces aberdarensis]
MSTFFSSDDSTGFATYTHNTMEEMALDVLAQELGDNIPETDDAWPASLYHNLTETTTIEGYLEKSGEYLDGRWVRMPASPKLKSELCKSLCDLISSFLNHFRVSRSEATRQAVDIHTAPFKPADAGSTGMFASPDVVVEASGPSFSRPKGASLGFSNVSACFIAKFDTEVDNVLDDLAQMAAFASGAQYSPLMNIHDDADQFIRLILGLCTTNEATLGFDDSVQWTTGPSGRKISGTLKTVGPDGAVVAYDLVMNEPPFVRTGIRGRGTICWPVQNASGDRFVIKDQRIAGSGTPEYELLAEAKGFPGVCQMVSYADNRAQTKDLRGNTKAFGNDTSFNRRAIRIVMKAYGPSIEKFSCVEEVLGVLRDAIFAHRALLSRDIIHRDISPNNILRGPPGAGSGDRGVLIDLDIAFKCHQLITESRADFKISLMVLRTWEMERKDISAQDYLDDLEGFFWVFSYLLFAYKANGKRAPENSMREHVLSWHQIPSIAYALKHTFLYSRRVAMNAEEDMDEGWRHACMDLFLEFRYYMGKLAMEKEDLLRTQRGEPEVVGTLPNKFSSLLENVDEHYGHILGLFDVALKKAKQVQENDQRQAKGIAAPHPTSTVDIPSTASVTAKNIPTAPSKTELPSSPSDQSTLTAPCDTPKLMPLTQPIPSRSPKRCSKAAGLDESPADVKRACPPNRRSLGAVVDPTLHVFNSVYEYCIKWL